MWACMTVYVTLHLCNCVSVVQTLSWLKLMFTTKEPVIQLLIVTNLHRKDSRWRCCTAVCHQVLDDRPNSLNNTPHISRVGKPTRERALVEAMRMQCTFSILHSISPPSIYNAFPLSCHGFPWRFWKVSPLHLPIWPQGEHGLYTRQISDVYVVEGPAVASTDLSSSTMSASFLHLSYLPSFITSPVPSHITINNGQGVLKIRR